MRNGRIAQLNQAGQSIWYDNISRPVLRSGELGRLIDAGVSGLTSNPTIFKKAIADTGDYDDDIREGAASGAAADVICERIMTRDVGRAADLLQHVFESSGGRDGFASIEVSPLLAGDTAATVEQARRLWGSLRRPNVMIKVPATAEGIPAIETLIGEGINVNVTLIFSVDVYGRVIEAYLLGLEERRGKGLPVSGVASVASFFVSRLDALLEKRAAQMRAEGRLTAEDAARLSGIAGIANSKLAYRRFLDVVESERFRRLAQAGAMPQRPLWASTGTKTPHLEPLHYVWALAGRDTVNTLPPATLQELLQAEPGTPSLETGIDRAEELWKGIGALGISLPQLLGELQVQGVAQFADSYRELLESVQRKRRIAAA